MDFDEKTFLLGIGAQKAGTSWLWSYLSSRGDVYLSSTELHFFDSQHRSKGHRRKRLLRKQHRIRNAKTQKILDQKLEQAELLQDEESYRNFFRERVPAAIRVFGEISPSYSLLGEDGFCSVRGLFRSRRIVFIMRDPVERFCSQMRMSRNKNTRRGSERADILSAIQHPRYLQKSRYEDTVRNLEAVFSPDDILYLFYETLFCREAIGRLCTFLALPYTAPDFSTVVNAGGVRDPLSPEIDNIIRNAFDATYRFCSAKFGDKLPSKWRTNG
jgi:hypothetical protein